MFLFPLSLWKAFQKDLEASGLSRDDLADICSVPYHVAARWFRLVAPEGELRPETPPPAEKFILAIEAMKQYRAWQIACERLGGFFTPHPKIDFQDNLSLFEQVENLHKTTVRLSEIFRAAITDNRVTPAELSGIIQAATESQVANQQMIVCARKMLKSGKK